MRFMNSVNSKFGIAFGAAASYGVGYAYGGIYRLNKTMSARAFAISAATSLIFDNLVNLASGGKAKNAEKYYTYHLIGGTALAVAQILVFRELNLIGSLGTAFLALNATHNGLENLHGYFHKS